MTAAPTAQETHVHAAHGWKASWKSRRASQPRITTLVARNLQRAAAVLVPLGLFTMTIRSISQARRPGDVFNDLLKILQSYGSGASVVLSALVASES
jgi:hypothetical protein